VSYTTEQMTACMREYRKKHPERSAEASKKFTQYMRDNYCSVPGGKQVKGPKRTQPATCELCEKELKRPLYHCWDAENTLHGIWCCRSCLRLISHSSEIQQKYEELRKRIEGE